MFKQLRIVKRILRLDSVPHTMVSALILAMCIVFAVQVLMGDPVGALGETVPVRFLAAWHALLAGDIGWSNIATVLTPFSAVFLHAGIEHILYNMIVLWIFGCLVSEHLGKWWMLGLFCACGIAGNLVQIILDPLSPIPILGASGAIYGLEGIYLVLAIMRPLPWPNVWPLASPVPPANLAALSVIGVVFDIMAVAGRSSGGIAYGAHVGGFAAGVMLALMITEGGGRGLEG